MKQTKTTKIALVSILTALSVVLGYIVKIPTQTGILTLLDAFSLLFIMENEKELLWEV